MTINLDEIEKALNEAESEDSTVEQVEYLYANAPEWLRLLVERVRELELDVMRVDVVLEAAKAVVEDGKYDVHYESRSAALIDSGLLLRLENAVKAIDSTKEST